MTLVRSIPGVAFNAYQSKRYPKLVAFAPLVRLQDHGIVELPRYETSAGKVSYHPSRTGFVDGEPPTEWIDDLTVDVGAITRRALVDFVALQNPWELRAFLDRIVSFAPRTILEIGTSCGGLLFALAQVAAPTARLASIDLPERADTAETAAALPHVLASLIQPTQTLHVVRNRSSLRTVRDEIARWLGDDELDLLVLDADHSYGGVLADFTMYSPFVRSGGLVAIHDAVIVPDNSGAGFEVGYFWNELPGGELLVDPEGLPGILHTRTSHRAASFGWGLIRR